MLANGLTRKGMARNMQVMVIHVELLCYLQLLPNDDSQAVSMQSPCLQAGFCSHMQGMWSASQHAIDSM